MATLDMLDGVVEDGDLSVKEVENLLMSGRRVLGSSTKDC
jgi:hypothetical protein